MTIIGHTKNRQQLTHAYQNNRLSHAFLMSGLDGIGKYTVAHDFAKSLLCSNRSHQESLLVACDSCSSCLKVKHNNHPDLIQVMSPAELLRSGLSTDKKSTTEMIKIDQIRNIAKLVHRPPYESSYRVIIIKNAENMNIQAANALLKSLEEPNDNNLIILTSSHPKQLLPTIISRVLHLKFAPLHHHELRELLENMQIENIAERLNADCLTLKQCLDFSLEEDVPKSQQEANKICNAVADKDSFALLESIENIGKDRLYATDVLKQILKSMHKQILQDCQEKRTPLPTKLRFMENVQNALSQIHKFNANVSIFLEELLILKS